jgi:hypothetical protein
MFDAVVADLEERIFGQGFRGLGICLDLPLRLRCRRFGPQDHSR